MKLKVKNKISFDKYLEYKNYCFEMPKTIKKELIIDK